MFQKDRLTTLHIRRHKRMQSRIVEETVKQIEEDTIKNSVTPLKI